MPTADGRLRQWGIVDILKAPHNRPVLYVLRNGYGLFSVVSACISVAVEAELGCEI